MDHDQRMLSKQLENKNNGWLLNSAICFLFILIIIFINLSALCNTLKKYKVSSWNTFFFYIIVYINWLIICVFFYTKKWFSFSFWNGIFFSLIKFSFHQISIYIFINLLFFHLLYFIYFIIETEKLLSHSGYTFHK